MLSHRKHQANTPRRSKASKTQTTLPPTQKHPTSCKTHFSVSVQNTNLTLTQLHLQTPQNTPSPPKSLQTRTKRLFHYTSHPQTRKTSKNASNLQQHPSVSEQHFSHFQSHSKPFSQSQNTSKSKSPHFPSVPRTTRVHPGTPTLGPA